ncbi:MAG: hypothetical protein M3016_05600 [Actinomycetota bacterium]|nr:hypothetical protein [Actinomycetota bacterium]
MGVVLRSAGQTVVSVVFGAAAVALLVGNLGDLRYRRRRPHDVDPADAPETADRD